MNKKYAFLWLVAGLSAISAMGLAAEPAASPEPAAPPAATEPARPPVPPAAGSEPAAIVNGERISLESFMAQLIANFGDECLNNMINDALISQEAHRLGIQITQAEIDNFVESRIRSQFKDDEDRLHEIYGPNASVERFYILYRGITVAKFAEKIREDVRKNRRWYEKTLILNRLFYYYDLTGEKVDVQHILFGTEEAAKKGLADIEAGANFAVLAMRESLDYNSRPYGGRLRPFCPGDWKIGFGGAILNEEFEKAAIGLEVGKTGGIVKTGAGFHVIKKLAHAKPNPAAYAQLKEKIDKLLSVRYVQPDEQDICLERLRAKARIEREYRAE